MSNQILDAMRLALSPARLATYERAVGLPKADETEALRLYAWNAAVASAFWVPLHLYEVVLRNAAADALGQVYGSEWPWSTSFERSLPDPAQGHSPRRDLQKARRGADSTGKVLPELTLFFWQSLFTRRHDARLWQGQWFRVLPHCPPHLSLALVREQVHRDVERIRALRNRIAHHEPIFARNLQADLNAMTDLIQWRCPATADWLMERQHVVALLAQRPLTHPI